MPNPYNLTFTSEGFYSFTTDLNSVYLLYLVDNTDLFGLSGSGTIIYEFGFAVDGNRMDFSKDPRVEATIIQFISDFFERFNNDAILYVTDQSDGRQAERKRMFDLWFTRNQSKVSVKLIKQDFINAPIYSSIILTESNPLLQEILNLFKNR
ncbi:MAG: DUF6169 family protein [Cyclobacteriaceae bacterium]|nr:DUF6169 family protein [Cyclobacteriaceae bacterium]